MERIHRASRLARRRRLIADGLDRLGIALSVSCGVGLLAVIVSRLIGEPIDWRWAALPPIALGVVFALAFAWRHRLTALEAATDVDTALSLRDRLGSSIELESLDRDDPFVQLLERDAEEAAGRVNIAEATPIRLGNAWLAWPTLAALLVVAVLFMPTLDLLGRQQAALLKAQEEARVEEASSTIDDIIEQTHEQLAQLDPTTEDELPNIMEELQRQLERGDLTPEEAEAQIAAALEEKSQQLQEQADLAQQTTEMLQEMLAESADPENTGASELEQALESGDFETAAEALKELQANLENMTEEQRQALAESMSEMADRLNEAAMNKQAQNNATQRMAEQLQQMGLSKELAEQLANSGDAKDIAEKLQQQGMDPETAKKLAEQLAQKKSESDSKSGASRSAQSLAKALKQAGKGAGNGNAGEMGELGEALGGLSDEELEGALTALAAGKMAGMANDGGGIGGSKAGEGSDFNEQLPSGLGKSMFKDVENRKGGGEGEVAMRYTRERPIEWDDTASDAPMRTAKIREAAQAAEQAIEEQAISPRYRGAIRDYFERAMKVAPPAGPETAPTPEITPTPEPAAAPDAKPADQGAK